MPAADPSSPRALEAIARLAERVISGDVVFFIGAGFSIDSEGNTAGRLIRRLLVRFVALAWTLHADREQRAGSGPDEAYHLLEGFDQVFGLKSREREPLPSPDSQRADLPLARLVANAVPKLVPRYYEFNDWIARAFGRLLERIENAGDETFEELERLERYLMRVEPGDAVRLHPMSRSYVVSLRALGRYAGKALFLDTMGFHQPKIMEGVLPSHLNRIPTTRRRSKVYEVYGDRIRARHLVLARFAREGLCQDLVTTNYDLLLDGAFLLVGLKCLAAGDPPGSQRDPTPTAAHDHFALVRGIEDYATGGEEHQLARIVKIHGCAGKYREARQQSIEAGGDKQPFADVVRDLVFTYREVQNWRKDTWSQDLLRSILRTRTVAFAGYSAADPVIHNTLRNVYEELRDQLSPAGSSPTNPDAQLPENARAYFFDLKEKREFHALEVLRAASEAQRCDSGAETHEHPNLIPFSTGADGLGLDDQFVLLQHHVLRRLQRRTLEQKLREVGHDGFGRPISEAEVTSIVEDVESLIDFETQLKSYAEQLVAATWTQDFLMGYLRQAAIAQAAVRVGGGSVWRFADEPGERHWYAALRDYPEQTTVALLLELGIRKLVARRTCKDWRDLRRSCRVLPSSGPMVELQVGSEAAPPFLLTIRSRMDPYEPRPSTLPGVYVRTRRLEFDGFGTARDWAGNRRWNLATGDRRTPFLRIWRAAFRNTARPSTTTMSP